MVGEMLTGTDITLYDIKIYGFRSCGKAVLTVSNLDHLPKVEN